MLEKPDTVRDSAAMVAALRSRGVRDLRVLLAMAALPRDAFVDDADDTRLYDIDKSIAIGYGQTISMPEIVAHMTELLLHAGPLRKVLEIGTGSGYQTAVLASLVDEVHTIERIAPLQQRARRTLKALGFSNIVFKQANGYEGWPEHAPFDGIMVTAAATHIPAALCRQLAPGGRAVLPVGFNAQKLHVIDRTRAVDKTGDDFTIRVVRDVRFVPLVEDLPPGAPV
jgi:protein-L-isoaspartate(D-aspartate) O-methyltransferase